MKSILVELNCPNCNYHTYRKSETLLISDFETNAREELLNDAFFTLRCPRCGTLIEFLHPLAYVDKQHHFILLIKKEQAIQAKDRTLYAEDTTSRKRYLSDIHQISEKIHILEDELDDRCIELLKYRLKNHYQNNQENVKVTYYDHDLVSKTLWFTIQKGKQKERVAIFDEEYQKIKNKMTKEEGNQFIKIEETWAKDWLKKN